MAEQPPLVRQWILLRTLSLRRQGATVTHDIYVQESTWHLSQRLAPQLDGSLVAEFDLSGTEEIKRWVLSFGKEAQVLEPDSLRLELAEEARQMIRLYEPQPDARRKTRPRVTIKPAASSPDPSKEGEE